MRNTMAWNSYMRKHWKYSSASKGLQCGESAYSNVVHVWVSHTSLQPFGLVWFWVRLLLCILGCSLIPYSQIILGLYVCAIILWWSLAGGSRPLGIRLSGLWPGPSCLLVNIATCSCYEAACPCAFPRWTASLQTTGPNKFFLPPLSCFWGYFCGNDN